MFLWWRFFSNPAVYVLSEVVCLKKIWHFLKDIILDVLRQYSLPNASSLYCLQFNVFLYTKQPSYITYLFQRPCPQGSALFLFKACLPCYHRNFLLLHFGKLGMCRSAHIFIIECWERFRYRSPGNFRKRWIFVLKFLEFMKISSLWNAKIVNLWNLLATTRRPICSGTNWSPSRCCNYFPQCQSWGLSTVRTEDFSLAEIYWLVKGEVRRKMNFTYVLGFVVLRDVIKVFPVSSSSFARKTTGRNRARSHLGAWRGLKMKWDLKLSFPNPTYLIRHLFI